MKTQTYNPGLHDVEIKVRLTEEDAAMIKAIAKREGLKPAAFARLLLKKQLHTITRAYQPSHLCEGPIHGMEKRKTVAVDGPPVPVQQPQAGGTEG
ncbi:hypothetical protein HAP94_07835 [Acidithiobacillus ferrivorans]|nr:hypothetical protein [Acidithiobacillus ferrivorans]